MLQPEKFSEILSYIFFKSNNEAGDLFSGRALVCCVYGPGFDPEHWRKVNKQQQALLSKSCCILQRGDTFRVHKSPYGWDIAEVIHFSLACMKIICNLVIVSPLNNMSLRKLHCNSTVGLTRRLTQTKPVHLIDTACLQN